MKRRLYALRDNKVGEFNPPCVFPNDAAAIRSFGDMVERDKDSLISLHPEDFSLYFLGEFSSDDGVLSQPVPPVALATGSDFAKGK